MRFVKKISERGVLTLPSDIREALEVEEGDIVEFEVLAVVKRNRKKTPAPTGAVSDGATPEGGNPA